ncbi:MAG: hypothetical protein ABI640_05105 [Gammaproteobacteria bacterium]
MAWQIDRRWMGGVAAIAMLVACSKPVPNTGSAEGAPTKNASAATATPALSVAVTEASFRCLRDMTPVRDFFVDNLLGDLDATVAVAESPTGGTYPLGSLVQVIPTTAMVKHPPGYSPATNDWEFIELDVKADGVTILGRGFAELNMRSGPNCLGCHKPAKAAWDLICDRSHDCIPIPLTPITLRALQNTDPRCPKIELPQDQIDALAALAATPPVDKP